jgi:hypothetical protein
MTTDASIVRTEGDIVEVLMQSIAIPMNVKKKALETIQRELSLSEIRAPLHIDISNTYNKPDLLGSSGGHFTRGGERVRYPSAYGRKGWSNMHYVRSSVRLVVPYRWIDQNFPELAQQIAIIVADKVL